MINSGVIYIKDGNSTTHKTYGYRDRANEIRNNKTTAFPTASAGKVFVAVAILQLIEEGLITLESSLGDIFHFPLGNLDLSVTIRQLLTHTSGIPNYADENKYPDYAMLWTDYPNYKIRSSKDLLPLFIHEKMQYDQIGTFHYNDSGFVVLGLVIEELKHIPFDQYLKESIFDPLGMVYTGYYELDRLPKNCANAYIFDNAKNEYYTNIYSIDCKGSGAGGAYTNAIDINRFWEGLLQYKLLSKEMTIKMLSKHQSSDQLHYGLGIWLDAHHNPMFIGEDPGATFITHYHLHTHKQITIISNMQENIFKILMTLV